ncbi:hypothetical protein AMTRI_Chr11g98170 [Amborella trichopoda]|uniref:zinc finger BED domain-containing protein RICESLEEPER 1-like isoform X1 n=2 Tax=Amborella trichopoda TaxID=13333 RepID=UPI0009BD3F72|nr:zinc finger BED domain-containing protein RICESLEEPER 1-like isoform X1 [Amborella trichopoda]|eukprot:XP_020527202.1 zinc finger BED domain-containing protein RICESLEEPER 1-like isoform X1 [Amborella trichopoda]
MIVAMLSEKDTVTLGTQQSSSSKRRKTTSIVWEHFTMETFIGGCRKARCKYCLHTFAFGNGAKQLGTSHLKRHLGICPKNRNSDRKQELLTLTPKDKNEGNTSLSNPKFDQSRSREDLARMIILHEYPLSVVEHPAFINFVQSLQPRFKMVNQATVRDDCLAIYQKEKQSLMQLLQTIPGRISLSLDKWTTEETLEYMRITGHFVDCDFKLQKRVLNFTMLPYPFTRNDLSDVILTCLTDWNILTKLSTVTLDRHHTDDCIGSNLKDCLSSKNMLLLSGRVFNVCCCADVLNLIVQDGLEAINDVIHKIRESVKYVKASQAHEQNFSKLFQQLEIPSKKDLCLDVQGEWNTTFLMLEAALEFKQAFSCLGSHDSNYEGAPSEDEWKKVEVLCIYLKVFYDVLRAFSEVTHPTANLYFHELWKIHMHLNHTVTSPDIVIIPVIRNLQDKFDKYWREYSLVLAIAVSMDPRFKMKFVEFSFSKVYGTNAFMYTRVVIEAIRDLYSQYARNIPGPVPLATYNGDQSSSNNSFQINDGLQDFDQFLSELSGSQQTKSELDQYLEEPLFPRNQEFDILRWWKMSAPKYPVLSEMARDILAIRVTTVDSESMFNTGGKVLDQYQSSLSPETIEALICARDWLHHELETSLDTVVSDFDKNIGLCS